MILAAVCLVAVASCGGESGDDISNGRGNSVDRDELIEQLVNGARGTVGANGTACVEDYLRGRSDDELDRLLNEGGR